MSEPGPRGTGCLGAVRVLALYLVIAAIVGGVALWRICT